jgi:Flp pilus assembly protein TadD
VVVGGIVGLLFGAAGVAHAQGAVQEVTITSKSPKAVAAFKKARELNEGQRQPEAVVELKKAVQLDPDFAVAAALLSSLTPGPEGDKLIDKAVGLAAKLPEPERLQVEAYAAMRKGDTAKSIELANKIAEAVPGDWRAQETLANIAMNAQKYDQAVDRAKKALAVNPKAATLYNTLAYAYASQNKWDDAIAAAKMQADLLPKEPNPQDTLAEMLLRSGRFAEAESAFQKALKISPAFANAWNGIALARIYRGDLAGVEDALARGNKAAALPQVKFDFAVDQAWAKLAGGKLADGLAILTAAEKQAEAMKMAFYAGAALQRGWMDYASEKYADALTEVATAQDRLTKGGYAGGPTAGLRRTSLLLEALSEAKLAKAADAEKTVAAMAEQAKNLPDGHVYHVQLAWARGLVAAAKGDPKAAVAATEPCMAAHEAFCVYDRMQLQEKAGDPAGAAKSQEEILSQYQRDMGFAAMRNKLAPPAKAK